MEDKDKDIEKTIAEKDGRIAKLQGDLESASSSLAHALEEKKKLEEEKDALGKQVEELTHQVESLKKEHEEFEAWKKARHDELVESVNAILEANPALKERYDVEKTPDEILHALVEGYGAAGKSNEGGDAEEEEHEVPDAPKVPSNTGGGGPKDRAGAIMDGFF